MELTEHDLIDKFTRGDPRAFTAIYNKYNRTVYFFVRRFTNEKEDAEDITADVFFKLWRNKASLDKIRNIEAFLYMTARNTCLDFLRKMQRQSGRQEEMMQRLLEQPEETFMLEDIRVQVLAIIHEEIERLPKSCRTVFKMAFLQGLSNEEIAAALHITNQSVRNFKQRALKMLRIKIRDRRIPAGMMAGAWLILARMVN